MEKWEEVTFPTEPEELPSPLDHQNKTRKDRSTKQDDQRCHLHVVQEESEQSLLVESEALLDHESRVQSHWHSNDVTDIVLDEAEHQAADDLDP